MRKFHWKWDERERECKREGDQERLRERAREREKIWYRVLQVKSEMTVAKWDDGR